MTSPQENPSQDNVITDGNSVDAILAGVDGGDAPANHESPGDPADGEAGLINLREQLKELRERFDATDAQIAGYLRESALAKGGSTNGEAISQIQHSLDRLLTKFEASQSAASPTAESGQLSEVLEAVSKLAQMQKELAQKIVQSIAKRITEEMDLLRFQQIVHETLTNEWDRREAEAQAKLQQEAEESLAESEEDISLQEPEPAEEEPEPEDPSAEAWSRAIWGPGLVEKEGFTAFLDELNRRLLEGDPGIATLAGQLLVFRQAPPEAKPQLLKDVGEAYYRTRIDKASSDHPFERALISWLQKDCEQAGLRNTIEVVHPGERFDNSRHSSMTRGGAEVSEVFGWVVLTEGGRVYTRASVAAQ